MGRLLSLVFLVAVGFFIGISQSQTVVQRFPALQAVVAASDASLVRCATEVNTKGWQLFRSDKLAFQLSYPQTYTVAEKNDTVTITNGSADTITLTKLHDTLKHQLDPGMVQAGWKIADRKVYALTTPYYTNDDGNLSSTYLFVRDFPQSEADGRYAMVKATITLTGSDPSFTKAREAGLIDVESILNVPEQILSTFRFLALDEIR